MPNDTIFETIHGSHLYGMAHEGSDMDVYRVVDQPHPSRRRARHNIEGNVDSVVVPFPVFITRIQGGSHQALEALFSPQKVWNPDYEYLRPMMDAYRVTGPEVLQKYRRTITKFCYGDYKRRRHAVRLRGNLVGLQNDGIFNPVMSGSDIRRADYLARHYEGDALRELLLERW